MTVLVVGRSVIFDERRNKNRKLQYSDIKTTKDDWVDVKQYLPIDFDIVQIKTYNKKYNGWSVGTSWDGLKLPENENVTHWKRRILKDEF